MKFHKCGTLIAIEYQYLQTGSILYHSLYLGVGILLRPNSGCSVQSLIMNILENNSGGRLRAKLLFIVRDEDCTEQIAIDRFSSLTSVVPSM